MKLKLVVLAAMAFLTLGVSSANAFQWHMRYGQAVLESKRYAKETCEEVEGCTEYAWDQCFRRGPAAFECFVGTFFPPRYVGESWIECSQALRWGVSYRGYIVLKGSEEPMCFAS